jgi:hypothetical protein
MITIAAALLLLFTRSAYAVNCRINRPPECAKPSAHCIIKTTPLVPDLQEAIEKDLFRCVWQVLTPAQWEAFRNPPNRKTPPPLNERLESMGPGDTGTTAQCIHERPYECVTAMCAVHLGPNAESVWERVQPASASAHSREP